MNSKRFYMDKNPLVLEENIVKGEKYRFTVLTSKLIRMEYSKTGVFEDRAGQTVFHRNFPVCKFESYIENGILTIKTEDLILTYIVDSEFTADSLSVKLRNEPATAWRFGEEFETLGGTAKTLDKVNDTVPLGIGVCSRFGFSVIDESDSLVLGEDGWVETRTEGAKDLYFFGYGFDYKGAVKDFYKLTGAPPLLPGYALGNWWSRYYKYTQDEYLQLMDKFKEENIPFTVAVVDMDWHITNIPEELREEDPRHSNGWTGYTWNEEYFPDYKGFLKHLKDKNLKTALNLHPASGVCRHEIQYNEMAKAMGIDPKSGKRVPFDILSKDYMEKYFDILHHPFEEDGVDFWWMDWQQGTDYWWIHEPNKDGQLADPREKLDPLWMLNHLHIIDIMRNGKRPMFFSRFSGAGSHRYPIGFSGDTVITWDALKFQPYFTATASNIGYCWWSHDIGGHMNGYCDQELTTRWIQLGVFSPINRLHSSADEFLHKEPWYFDCKYEKIIKQNLQLRHKLFPYLYTMNYRCSEELEPLIQPMYYSYPKCSAAYEVPNQYWFGSELMVAPITDKSNDFDNLAKTQVWLPKGEWFDFFTGIHYSGLNGRKINVYRDISSYPVFAKQGAIVPLQSLEEHSNSQSPSKEMEIVVFAGASNKLSIYEDGLDGNEYKNDKFALTDITLDYSQSKAAFEIAAVKGDTAFVPKYRNWKIAFRGFSKQCDAKVYVDGKEVNCAAEYCFETHSLYVNIGAYINQQISIVISGEEIIYNNDDVMEKCRDLILNSNMPYAEKNRVFATLKRKDIGNIHDLFALLTGVSEEEFHLLDALKEYFILTRDEFDNCTRY